MGKEGRPLVVLGTMSDHAAERVREAADSLGTTVHRCEKSSEFNAFLESADPLAVLVKPEPSLAAPCVKMRSNVRHSHIPIFGLAGEYSDLAFVELFVWGGDDLITLDKSVPLARRLRHLAAQKLQPSHSRPAAEGYALVAGAEPQWRTMMARVLFNGGYVVRFASNTLDAVEESRADGVRLVVAADSLRPEGAAIALAKSRDAGCTAPWIILAPPKRMALVNATAGKYPRVAVADAFAPPENALFVANELARQQGTDKRASARLLYGTTVAFRQAGREEDEWGFTYNASAQGLYVRTLAPLDPGAEVWLEMWPPRTERRVRLAGRVAWRRNFGPAESATVPPGFGVQITHGLADDLERYREGYRMFATGFGVGVETASTTLPPTR